MTVQEGRRAAGRSHFTTIWIPVLAVVAVGLMATGSGVASAQDVHLGIDFLTGFPQGEFNRNLDRNGYGVAGYGMYGMRRLPLGIGFELGYMNYGSEERREPLSPTIPDAIVRVRTSHNILTGHLVLRLQGRGGNVRPYADGLAGFKYLYTRTSVRGEGFGEPIASSTNLDDWALSYGAGGGLQILLYQERSRGKKGRPLHIVLDAKLRYLRGSRADYLTQPFAFEEDGLPVYEINRSRTDMLAAQLGVVFRF